MTKPFFLLLLFTLLKLPHIVIGTCGEDGLPSEMELSKWREKFRFTVVSRAKRLKFIPKIENVDFLTYMNDNSWDNCISEVFWSLLNSDNVVVNSSMIESRYFNKIEVKKSIQSCHKYSLKITLLPVLNVDPDPWFEAKSIEANSAPHTHSRPKINLLEIGSSWIRVNFYGGDLNCKISTYIFSCENNFQTTIPFDPDTIEYDIHGFVPETSYLKCSVIFVYNYEDINSLSSYKALHFDTTSVRFKVNDVEARSARFMLEEPYLSYIYYRIKYRHEHPWMEWKDLDLSNSSVVVRDLVPHKNYTFCFSTISNKYSRHCYNSCNNCKTVQTLEDQPESPPIVQPVTEKTSNSFVLQWKKPKFPNGKIIQYDLTIESRCPYDYSVLCKTEPCTEWKVPAKYSDIIHVSSEITSYSFTQLETYTLYRVNVSAYTAVGKGPQSNLTILTKPSLKNAIIDFRSTFDLQSVVVNINPPCPHVGPLFFVLYIDELKGSYKYRSYSIKRNKTDLEIPFSEQLEKGKDYKICLTVRFERADEPCDISIQGNCETTTGLCRTGRTKEDFPGDYPKIEPSRNYDLSKNSFLVRWRSVKMPNGIITSYELEIRGRCKGWDREKCPDALDCTNFTILEDQFKKLPAYVKYLSFYNLNSYWLYQVRIRALNSVGAGPWSPWEDCEITTRPTVNLEEFSFLTSSTSKEVSLSVSPYCPYTGPLSYIAMLDGNTYSAVNLNYDLALANEDLSASFKDVEPGKKYTICLSVSVGSNVHIACRSDCNSIVPLCKEVEAVCSEIPQAEKIPQQMRWSIDDSFNPFSSAIVKMEANTFDGSQNGIQSLQIIHAENKSLIRRLEKARWNQDVNILVNELSFNSSYNVQIRAVGCKNSIETETFPLKTMTIIFPEVNQIRDEALKTLEKTDEGRELLKKYNSGTNMGLFHITESKVNVLFGKIEQIYIGNSTWEYGELFSHNAISYSLQAGKKCCHPTITDHQVSCFIVANIHDNKEGEGAIEVPIKMESRVSASKSHKLTIIFTGLTFFAVAVGIGISLVFRRRLVQRHSKIQKKTSCSMARIKTGPSNPIKISDFVKNLESGQIDLREEFRELDQCETTMIAIHKTMDQAIHNRDLNRYNNILPYDDSLVRIGGDVGYINANWIKQIDGSSPLYIATQGPTKNTIEHFWKMIFENRVTIIVMLTKLMEKSKNPEDKTVTMVPKCEQYWPKQGKKYYGEITVELLEEHGNTQLAQLIERKFKISCNNKDNGSNHLTVLQLHFIGWPDHGAPTSPKKLLSLLSVMQTRTIDMNDGLEKVIIAVHCSAGVGRTGTLLALDIISKEIEEGNDTVDVMATVFELRQHRCKMVQQPIQYKYLYHCVAAYIQENVQTVKNTLSLGLSSDVEVQYM